MCAVFCAFCDYLIILIAILQDLLLGQQGSFQRRWSEVQLYSGPGVAMTVDLVIKILT